MVSLFTTIHKMRFNLALHFLPIAILFGSVIQARWSRTLPRSETKKILKIFTSQIMVKPRGFRTIPKKFEKKSNKEVMEKYCRFLLGAYQSMYCFKLRKVRENGEKQKRRKNTSISTSTTTTSSLIITANEKIYVRI